MLKRSDLESLKSVIGFNLWQVEKDYLQHLFLLFLSRYISNVLIFKGGTALQKTFGLNRFSTDMDFTLKESFEIENIAEKIKADFEKFGYSCTLSEEKTEISTTLLFKINGPLYDGTERSISTLRIEISTREEIILQPELREVVPIYPDLQPYFISILNSEELLAEKVRAILVRTKARDIYDLWFLLKKGIKFKKELVTEKLKYYNLKFSKKKLFKKIKTTKSAWKTELEPLIAFIPEFKKVLSDIKNLL